MWRWRARCDGGARRASDRPEDTVWCRSAVDCADGSRGVRLLRHKRHRLVCLQSHEGEAASAVENVYGLPDQEFMTAFAEPRSLTRTPLTASVGPRRRSSRCLPSSQGEVDPVVEPPVLLALPDCMQQALDLRGQVGRLGGRRGITSTVFGLRTHHVHLLGLCVLWSDPLQWRRMRIFKIDNAAPPRGSRPVVGWDRSQAAVGGLPRSCSAPLRMTWPIQANRMKSSRTGLPARCIRSTPSA